MDGTALRDDILAFWFGPAPDTKRDLWFAKDAAFDARLRERYGAAIARALEGGWREWDATAQGALARILLLDQFTRNAFRDTPRAFAGDALALEAATRMVDAGEDRDLQPLRRVFAYLPFEHAEDVRAQARAVALFEALARESGDASWLDWARKHAVVIERFGRFPHRNGILGRASTPDEIAFLREPGSRF